MRNDFIGLKTIIELKFQTVKAPYFGTVGVFFCRVAKTLFNFFYSVLCNDKKNECVLFVEDDGLFYKFHFYVFYISI